MTSPNERTSADGDDGAARPTPPDRPPLSPERIFRAALDIITRDGADALTMRRVASALHVEPMSLYHHVPSKNALIDGAVGLALEGVGTFEDLAGTWQEQVSEAARRLRRELLRNPRAATLVATRPMHSEQVMAMVESGLGRLHDLGFDLETAAEILWTMNDYVIGNVLNWVGARGGVDPMVPSPEEAERMAERFNPLRYPYATKVIDEIASEADAAARFERGLDAVVTGIADRFPSPT